MVDTSTKSSRRRTPALAFLIGALVVGAVALAVYLFWGGRAETPTTPAESLVTDEINMPPPDADGVRAQVEQALRETPAPTLQPAQEAVSAAEAQARAPETVTDRPVTDRPVVEPQPGPAGPSSQP